MCDGVVRHVVHRQPAMAVFFVLYVVLTTFGILNVVVGVIVEATLGEFFTRFECISSEFFTRFECISSEFFTRFECISSEFFTRFECIFRGTASSNEAHLCELQAEEKKATVESLRRVFELSDSDKSGSLNRDEFLVSCGVPEVRDKLEVLGIATDDAEELFALLDPTGGVVVKGCCSLLCSLGNGDVKLNDFLASCMQLVGGAQTKDIMQVSVVQYDCKGEIFSTRRYSIGHFFTP
jgi:hypothetical protein